MKKHFILIYSTPLHLTSDLVDALGESLDVRRRDTADGDAAVAGRVDGVFLCEGVDLFGLQARVGEHADL